MGLNASDLLFMQFHTAKLFLYQVAFFERNLQQSPALHLNILCEGLESAKSFLDLYLWLPPKSEMSLTNSEWIQLSFGVTQAAKFAIVSKEPNVEPQTRELRHRLNIDHVFRHLSLRIGALVGRASEGNKQKDIFYYYEQRVRKIQNWFEKMTRAIGRESPESQQRIPRAPAVSNQGLPSSNTPPTSASAPAVPQVPVSATFKHQQPQPLPYPNVPLPIPGDMLQPQATTMGMAPINSYSSYSPIPTIAYDDLMSAPGWDTLFTVPMEDTAWLVDVSQGYNGMNMASPPSDPGWGDAGSYDGGALQ